MLAGALASIKSSRKSASNAVYMSLVVSVMPGGSHGKCGHLSMCYSLKPNTLRACVASPFATFVLIILRIASLPLFGHVAPRIAAVMVADPGTTWKTLLRSWSAIAESVTLASKGPKIGGFNF